MMWVVKLNVTQTNQICRAKCFWGCPERKCVSYKHLKSICCKESWYHMQIISFIIADGQLGLLNKNQVVEMYFCFDKFEYFLLQFDNFLLFQEIDETRFASIALRIRNFNSKINCDGMSVWLEFIVVLQVHATSLLPSLFPWTLTKIGCSWIFCEFFLFNVEKLGFYANLSEVTPFNL